MIAVITIIGAKDWPAAGQADPHGLRDASAIMQAMRRRIEGDEASSDDQRRYRIAAATVERIAQAFAAEHRWTAVHVDAESLSALLGAAETIYPPDELPTLVESRAEVLENLGKRHPLTKLLGDAVKKNAGIVISIQPNATESLEELPAAPGRADEVAAEQGPSAAQLKLADAIEALQANRPVPFAEETGTGARSRQNQGLALRNQIVEALRRGGAVPVGMAASHDVITEVLRELQDPALPGGQLRIIHVDSSEAATFPVGAHPASEPSAPNTSGRSIRLGLMSVRHMTSDASVAGYWFRNRLVSVNDRTLAETEAFCYRDTLARLGELAGNGITHIEMLHTGFEPAAIGFYRGLLAYNANRTGSQRITATPIYLHGREVTGTPWVAGPGSTDPLLTGNVIAEDDESMPEQPAATGMGR